jgi:glucokinase
MISVGIDIGGTSVKVAALQDGQLLWSGQSGFYARPTTEQLIQAIWDATQNATHGRWEKGELGAKDDIKVGMCCPGLLDREKRIITLSVNVPGLMNVPLDELASRGLGKQVDDIWLGSDAVAGTYDIADAKGYTARVCGIAIGTGVGGAVLDDGTPLAISGASPGHFGQLDVTLPDEPDTLGPDGGQGSLEGYLGVAALKKRYATEDLSQPLAIMKATDAPMRALARAVRIAHAIYRPQHFILLGGLGIRLGHVVPSLKAEISRNLTRVAREGWTLTAGTDDYHNARGAAKLAIRAAAR